MMKNDYYSIEDLEDKHIDYLITLAYRYLAILDTQSIIDSSEEVVSSDLVKQRIFREFEDKYSLLKKENRKQQNRHRYRRRFIRFIEIAACIIVILGITAPLAIANVSVVRFKVMELLINIEERYTEISLVENQETSFDVPTEWKGSYFPSYIPEEYRLDSINPCFNRVRFKNAKGEYLMFEEYTVEEINLDTENAILSNESIHGNDALVVEKNDYTVVWSDDNYYFIISSDESKEIALEVSRSIRRVK